MSCIPLEVAKEFQLRCLEHLFDVEEGQALTDLDRGPKVWQRYQ